MITALEYLDSLNSLGSIPGLASITELLLRLNNPQNQLKIIHIAGTNGKGSVGAFVDRIFINAGYKTGRFSSPAVMDPYEVIRINGENICEEEYKAVLDEVKNACDEMVGDALPHPTRFEVETAAAYLFFYKNNVDYALIECGMGGRLDATNVIINTMCSVITPISIDHTAFLGDTIEEIAGHKAGIIKENSKVVCAGANGAVQSVIVKECEKNNAELLFLNDVEIDGVHFDSENMLTEFSYRDYEKIKLRMNGIYQCKNAALAIEVINAVNKCGGDISREAVYKGLYEATWEGRFERIHKAPDFIIDGAHNPGGAKALCDALKYSYGDRKWVFILGIFKDKDIRGILDEIAPLAAKVITIETPLNERALDSKILADIIENNYNIPIEEYKNIGQAVRCAMDNSGGEHGRVACGSLSNLKRIKEEVQVYADRRKGVF